MTCPAHDQDLSEPCTCDPQRIRDRIAREAARRAAGPGLEKARAALTKEPK